jgi:hypothetical protein
MGYSAKCCRCKRAVGDDVKVQPTRVDGEVFCPGCFVTRRMREEPSRFNATQACAATCPICKWVSVSFGAIPGQRLRCGYCLRMTARRLPIESLPFTPDEARTIEQVARDSGFKEPHRLPGSRTRA